MPQVLFTVAPGNSVDDVGVDGRDRFLICHAAEREPHILHYLAHISWVGSVLNR